MWDAMVRQPLVWLDRECDPASALDDAVDADRERNPLDAAAAALWATFGERVFTSSDTQKYRGGGKCQRIGPRARSSGPSMSGSSLSRIQSGGEKSIRTPATSSQKWPEMRPSGP